ncbi:DUF1700 domain-containing protein [Staphylococcus coagulans]|uniref:DUF1700 domain-containing protein n=1 Tax=Staphylococcus coagulans TaxID=74706 RepID=A0ABU1EY76_9STAP|nr:DUF1700 domain-containing protein [Staphylococcus coagulans]MDR5603063.1 DUF1700 domain-containing protein [Staphylococcus coagulans]MDR9833414.1 DUF1700 domain-containing protein [Staphylococcus coagulans]
MDKITFLNELEYQLHRLPDDKIDEVMNTYENYFYQEGRKGKTDRAIVKELDTPKQIAKQQYAKYAVKNAESKPDVAHIAHAVFATIGMSVITLFFILVPLFFVMIITLLGTFIALGMLLSPILLLIMNIWSGLHSFSLSNYLFSFAYLGLGAMFLVIIIKFIIAIRNLLIRYLKWNVNFIKKGTS